MLLRKTIKIRQGMKGGVILLTRLNSERYTISRYLFRWTRPAALSHINREQEIL